MAGISKEEYLKRYLSPAEGSQTQKKKRKKKTSQNLRKGIGMKIVDDDVGWDAIASDQVDDINDKLLTLDEKPQIENIDDRTEEEKEMDKYRRSKLWKNLDRETSTASKTKARHDSDSDLDLQRRPNAHLTAKSSQHSSSDNSGSDLEVPRPKSNHVRHDSDSDFDIPRNNVKPKSTSYRTMSYDKNSDLNIPRKKTQQKESHKKGRHDSDSDLELPRKKTKTSSSDQRKTKVSSSTSVRHDSDSDLDVQRKSHRSHNTGQTSNVKKVMESGGRSGLTSVDLLRLEMKKLEKQESHVKKLAEEYKDTTTVYRERGSGKKRNLNKEKEENDKEKEKRKKKEDLYDKWGKGLKQMEMRAESIADTLHESNKTLSRFADDEDLEAMRKEAVRDGDPMAEYISRKKQKEKGDKKEYPKYRGPAPAPNRYKIQPGYRWDGVDRSNGFEKKYFENLSNKQAFKDEYYKWSTSDM